MRPMINSQLYLYKGLSKLINHLCIWYISPKPCSPRSPVCSRSSGIMSLKPKRVDFATTWATLKETIQGVITFSNVPRAVWNDRFTGL